MKELLVSAGLTLASIIFTLFGLYLLFFSKDLTNGLLALIVGELIDMPKRKRP